MTIVSLKIQYLYYLYKYKNIFLIFFQYVKQIFIDDNSLIVCNNQTFFYYYNIFNGVLYMLRRKCLRLKVGNQTYIKHISYKLGC
jgi:hypothetical protein